MIFCFSPLKQNITLFLFIVSSFSSCLRVLAPVKLNLVLLTPHLEDLSAAFDTAEPSSCPPILSPHWASRMPHFLRVTSHWPLLLKSPLFIPPHLPDFYKLYSPVLNSWSLLFSSLNQSLSLRTGLVYPIAY